jgi:hypothetical protein
VFAGLILVVALVALVVQRLVRAFRSTTTDGTVVIAMPTGEGMVDAAAVTAVLRRQVAGATLEGVSQSETEMVLSYRFRSISEAELLELPGAVRSVAGSAALNVFFNRPGAL